MNECLVTKLRGVVDDNSILKLGEIRIVRNNRTPVPDRNIVSFTEKQTITILNNGTFENGSNILVVPANTRVNITASEGSIISIPNKYAIKTFNIDCYDFDIEHDIKQFSYCEYLNDLIIYGTKNTEGNLNSISKLNLNNLEIMDSNLIGNISDIKNMSGLKRLILINNNHITGDTSAIQSLNLDTISIYGNSMLRSNIEFLTRKTTLRDLIMYKNSGYIYGDLSKLNTEAAFISFYGTESRFTWTKRIDGGKIFGMEYANLGDYVDTMLIDLAALDINYTPSDREWFKKILVYGNRTSASDSAVSALQEKGITILILNK